MNIFDGVLKYVGTNSYSAQTHIRIHVGLNYFIWKVTTSIK